MADLRSEGQRLNPDATDTRPSTKREGRQDLAAAYSRLDSAPQRDVARCGPSRAYLPPARHCRQELGALARRSSQIQRCRQATPRALAPAGRASPLPEHLLAREQSGFATRSSALKVGTGPHSEREELSSWEHRHLRNETRRPTWRICADTSRASSRNRKVDRLPGQFDIARSLREVERAPGLLFGNGTPASGIWFAYFRLRQASQVPRPPRALAPLAKVAGLFSIGTGDFCSYYVPP